MNLSRPFRLLFLPLLLFAALAQTTAEAPQKRVRVGITVCQFGATGPSWIGRPYGFGQLNEVLGELRDTSVDVVPVIEPDTEGKPETKTVLDNSFENQKTVSMYDAKALENLDVLIVVNCWDIHQDALDAIEAAAKHGLNLIVVSGVGIAAPETNGQTQRITGIDSAIYGWNPKAVNCTVIAAHPLLGDLKKGDELSLDPNGMFGNFKDASPLVQVNSMDDIYLPESDKSKGSDMIFAPLYLSKLDKGRIVGVSWASWTPPPAAIDQATQGRFYERAALWLAGRTLPPQKKNAEFEKYGIRIKNKGGVSDAPVVEIRFIHADKAEDAVLQKIAGFSKIERLYLPNAVNIHDDGVKTLSSLTSLQTLQLTHSQITDAGVKDLKNLTQLQWLDLSESEITDDAIDDLQTLTKLRWLNLQKTQITAQAIDDLRAILPNCRIEH